MRASAARSSSTRKSPTRKLTARKGVAATRAAKVLKPVARAVPTPPEQVPFRFCKPGWAVIVEKISTALGTRFVCPFCTVSHRVPGPVRGFRKMRRAQWIKLRRVAE